MHLFGLDLYKGSKEEFVKRLLEIPAESVAVVVTPNVDHLRQVESDPTVGAMYRKADVFLIDGVPLLLLCRALRGHGYSKISGSELFPRVLTESSARCLKVGVLGGSDASSVRNELSRRYPLLDLVVYAPRMGFDPAGSEAEEAATFFRNERVDLIFACLGMPKQEAWAIRFRDRVGARAILCVGGALDFVIGKQKRAPAWVAQSGFEWLWRCATSPRRLWLRYARGLVWILPAFTKEYLKRR